MTKFLGIFLLVAGLNAQQPHDVWQRVEKIPANRPASDRWIQPQKFHAFNVNHSALRAMLARAGQELPHERRAPDTEITLPMPDGSLARFNIIESPIMEPELAAKFPQIKTYRGVGVDDSRATVRLDLTPQGFHAQILSPHGAVYIDPYWRGDNKLHTSYYKRDYRRDVSDWTCLARGSDTPSLAAAGEGDIIAQASGGTLRTYRLACAADVEYVNFHGGTVALGLAAVVTAINRVTGVYEVELAIRMVLIANNDLLIYTGNANQDPYTNNNGSTMLGQNQSNIDSVIGTANYDIGHVFSTGGGGIAGLGVVCVAGNKARGVTGNPSPVGDSFWIDFVAHEMGHQFGANHTFNSTTGNCSGNRNASTAYEVGSGSTIMAYAGICSTDDLQPHSDPYFHSISYEEIMSYVAGSGNCSVNSSTGNTAPNVPGNGGNFTIPASTPFILTATGSDPNGDALTFCWEERDLGAAQTVTAADNGASPIFRSFNPTASPSRIFPRIEDILGNTNSVGEKLPTTSRTMKFRVTVRDNRLNGGGVNSSATNGITVVSTAGPFLVTFPNTATNLAGNVTVTWNVANTASSPINTANVDILLSTDGGLTYPTVLLAGTPNDGSQTVTLPNITTSTARIKVQAAGNIYFDISNANFSIAPAIPLPLVAAGPSGLSAENCVNSAIDPGETVTVSLTLTNAGTANASNVVATLLATGGVTSPSGAKSYGTLLAGGAAVANTFTFTASGSCGGTVTATLQVQTNGVNFTTVPFNFNLGVTTSSSKIITNASAIAIPASGNRGVASPYPSTIAVAGMQGPVTKVTVTLRNFAHTYPDDVDVLLVGPTGAKTLLMSDAGNGTAVSNVTLTFDDAASTSLPDASQLTSGTYKPTDFDTTSDAFNSPAPAGPYTASLAAFNGTDPNGTWSLYVLDDATGDTGSIGAGWILNVLSASNVCCTAAVNQPPAITNAFITAAATNTTQNLTALAFASDPDNDPVSFAYQWQESLSNLAGQTNATLLAASTFAGGSYRCVITPNDGQTNGPAFPTAAVLVPVDSDSDGLNDDWEVTQFGNLTHPGDEDADGDGFTNAQEFQAGTDANSATSSPAIASAEPVGDDFVVTFATVTGKSYDVQRSGEIAGGWTTFTNLTASGSATQVTDPGGALQPARFYRVQVLP